LQKKTALLAVLFAAGCGEGIAPPEVDPPPSPYVRNGRGVRVFGVTNILVIPSLFLDGRDPPLTAADVRDRMFGTGTLGPMARVFRLASANRFALGGGVAPWVRTSVLTGTFADPGTVGRTRFHDHVVESIAAADDSVDYGAYDNDGPDGVPNSGDDDGVVDGGVVIVTSEYDQKCNGGTGKGPHPHAVTGPLGWLKTPDTLRTQDARSGGGFIGVTGFTALSVVNCPGTAVNAEVLTHELGHVLFGLPDLYHTATAAPPTERWRGRRWVVGCWDLMSAGSSWGCGAGEPQITGPNATLGAWTRTRIGWTVPILLSPESQFAEVRAPASGDVVVRIPISDHEYVLAEYRERVAGDLGLPFSGVILYHVNDSLPFYPLPSAARRYQVQLIEADDDSALVRIDAEGGNRGAAGDAFGHQVRRFGSATHSARTTAGNPLPFSIEDITIDARLGRARFFVRPGGR